MNVHTFTSPKLEPKPKQIITLTNRAPIKIVEDEWPVIAEGNCSDEPEGAPYGWSIKITVRHRTKIGEHELIDGDYIIHANYRYFDEDKDHESQRVRVGRQLSARVVALKLWKHILDVGDELRERIANEKVRKHVIYAIDDVFANLEPLEF